MGNRGVLNVRSAEWIREWRVGSAEWGIEECRMDNEEWGIERVSNGEW